MEGSCAWAPQGHQQGCGRLYRQSLCLDLTRGPRSVGAAMLSSRKTAPEKHQDLYMPRRRPSSVQPRRGRGKHLCASLAQARLRASALRRRRPGCLPQHTKRRWCGSGNSCVRMSVFIHRYAKERTLRRQVVKVLPANLPRNRGRNVRLRPPVT